MNSNELSFSAWRELEPDSLPSPSPSSLQMELDSEIPVVACISHPTDSQITFNVLYHEWYLDFQQNPTLTGPPPLPYTRPAAPMLVLLPHTRVYSPPPHVNLPVSASSCGIGKSLATKPESYDGDKEKYVQWWQTVQLYIAGFDIEPTDQQKILIVLSYVYEGK